jgi:hypothetical protein
LKSIILCAGVFLLALISFFSSCTKPGKTNTHAKQSVYIDYSKGKYTLYRNGEPFIVKGGAGYTNLKKLKEVGGNTIRTWDTLNIDQILDEAKDNGLAVIIQLPMPYNDDMEAFYKKDNLVAAQYKAYKVLVNKYKNHEALLSWCLGNELAFPIKPNYNKFYKAFNALVDMIHQDDPNHPVTTTMSNFHRKDLFNIKHRTDIDYLSFNVFGGLRTLEADLDNFSWAWDGPFLISEWGIEGPWAGHEQTAWGAFIENTSNKKAEQYLSTYKRYMPVKNPRFLGEMVFYWGQKQETTPTWFGLFDTKGNASEAVNVMQYLWTGTAANQHAPAINYMLVDGKGAKDNIIYKPDSMVNARVFMLNDASNKDLRFEWQLQPEDWFRLQHVHNLKPLKPLTDLIVSTNGPSVTFRTPLKEGPYRILVNIYDKNGYFAACNTPFYVVGDE